MRHNPRPQEIYRHFKGNLYQIRCLARHTETGELMVVYQAMYDNFEIYARPLPMFMEEVDHAKYPDVGQKYRFALWEDGQEAADQEETAPRERETAEIKNPAQKETVKSEPESEPMEQLNIDPLVLAFLDADSYQQRLDILDSLHNRITDDMINTMAVSVDLEIKEGDLEDRYLELWNCLRTFEKYECNRLR